MSATQENTEQGEGPLVLIVEDSRAIRTLAVRTLSQGGFSVMEACDGEQALATLRSLAGTREVALVLMDINMPGMTGIECLRAIRNEPALAKTRVVMASSENERTTILSCAALGIAGYIIKPYTTDKLLTDVRRLTLASVMAASAASLEVLSKETVAKLSMEEALKGLPDDVRRTLRQKVIGLLATAAQQGEVAMPGWKDAVAFQNLQRDLRSLFPE